MYWSPCFNTVLEKCCSGFMDFLMYTTASETQQRSHFSLLVVHFVGAVVKFLLHHGRRIYLGSILVIAREKELRHNLGARSQLIWPRWRRNSEGSSRPPFPLIPRSLHATCGGSGVCLRDPNSCFLQNFAIPSLIQSIPIPNWKTFIN